MVEHFLLFKRLQKASEVLVDIFENQVKLGVFIDDILEPMVISKKLLNDVFMFQFPEKRDFSD